jgi:type IV pilus assembly protein PilY1
MNLQPGTFRRRLLPGSPSGGVLAVARRRPCSAAADLRQKKVPPNLMLDLSVEWPTGVVAAYNDNYVDPATPGNAGYGCSGREDKDYGRCYFDDRTYLGYFDPLKCYDYVGNPGTSSTPPDNPSSTKGYFTPTAFGSGANGHQCTGKWSGTF